jgi:hypothetical protein
VIGFINKEKSRGLKREKQMFLLQKKEEQRERVI